MHTKKILLLLFTMIPAFVWAQSAAGINIKIVNPQQQSLANVTAALHLNKDSSLVKVQVSDTSGSIKFNNLSAGDYFIRITHLGYKEHSVMHFFIPENFVLQLPLVVLEPSSGTLTNVTVSARKPFVEMKLGKTIVNLDASITSIGATAMEALEKMPGITIDKDGNISLKGRSGVTVLIDGKQTYLDPAQLSTLLNGLNAAQINQVEIMDQPSARYDAAGNAGVINIKLKKNTQKGFNGNINTSFAQGFYPKNNNSLQLNYRSGNINLFLNYSISAAKNFTRIYALRKYFEGDGSTIRSMLEQPSFFNGKGTTQNIRTGMEYTISQKTTAGVTLTGLSLHRKGTTNNTAFWLDANRSVDSLITTYNTSTTDWRNVGINLNLRHAFSASRELTVDVDRIGYNIVGEQFFENKRISPSVYTEQTKADLPSDIQILSAKADYSQQIRKWKLEAGAKTSRIKTDNLAAYEYFDGANWKEDLGKSNHFLYAENIHAGYVNTETKINKWSLQGGLRYEITNYDAQQLGNAVVKDSSFSRRYNSLFPSASISYQLDSSNTFSFSAGRRIDRPAFQKLNPFIFIINKYTYQTGNPFFRPQYTWNTELSHMYKEVLITSISYNITRDYISQLFPIDNNGIVLYTEGNLKRLQNFGASLSAQLSPTGWWSFSSQAVFNYKKLEGFIGRDYKADIAQFHFNLNNQFRFNKGWAAEVSGFFTSRSQNDIQEVLDPAGQLSLGISKTILKNKGTVRLAARDIFYTNWMKGLTEFTLANEYFKLTRDTRVISIAFNYRFGKAFKTSKRSQGAASEEIERVGMGN